MQWADPQEFQFNVIPKNLSRYKFNFNWYLQKRNGFSYFGMSIILIKPRFTSFWRF